MSRKKSNPQERKLQRRHTSRQGSLLSFQQLEKRKLLAGLIFEMFDAGCVLETPSEPETTLVSEVGSGTIESQSSEGLETLVGCQGPADDGPGGGDGNFGQGDELSDCNLPTVGDDFNPGEFGDSGETEPWDGELDGDVENIRARIAQKPADDVVGIDNTFWGESEEGEVSDPTDYPSTDGGDESNWQDTGDSSDGDLGSGDTTGGDEEADFRSLEKCELYPGPADSDSGDMGEGDFSDVMDSPMPEVDDDFNPGEFGEPGDTDPWNGELAGEVENIDARFDGSEISSEELDLTTGLIWFNSVDGQGDEGFGWDKEVADEGRSLQWSVSGDAVAVEGEQSLESAEGNQLLAVIDLVEEGSEVAMEARLSPSDFSLLDAAFSDKAVLTLNQFLSGYDNDE
ncbi:MAG: hypothetical protein ACKO81_13935 [Planctomycetota bacterium]